MLTEMIFVTTNKSLAGLSNEIVFMTLTNCNDSKSYEGIDLLGKILSYQGQYSVYDILHLSFLHLLKYFSYNMKTLKLA